MIADEATLKSDGWSMNTGSLVTKLIKAGKIKPLVLAAASEKLALSKSSDTLFKTLDFSSFVAEVAKKAAEANVQIDLNKVAVVGWSGAGCSNGGGLHKVAQEVGSGKYKLFLLGCADTCVTGAAAKRVQDALGSSPTVVYSIHEGAGGGGPKFFEEKKYIDGFGTTRDLKGQALPSPAEDADKAAFELYLDNGDDKTAPTRTVAKVALGKKGLELHWGDFNTPTRQAHGQVPLVWSYYALQRFFK
jgi:hypothetical protein